MPQRPQTVFWDNRHGQINDEYDMKAQKHASRAFSQGSESVAGRFVLNGSGLDKTAKYSDQTTINRQCDNSQEVLYIYMLLGTVQTDAKPPS